MNPTKLLGEFSVLLKHVFEDLLAIGAHQHRHTVDRHGIEEQAGHVVVGHHRHAAGFALGTQDFKHLGTERILTPFHEVGPFGERLGLAVAVELHHRGTGDVTAGRADLDGVFAALHVPVIEPLRPVGKGAIVELEGDFCGFASLEEYLLEALKYADF